MSHSNSSFFRIWEIMISWKITLSVFKFNMHCFFFYFWVSLVILFRTAILACQCDWKTLNIWKRNLKLVLCLHRFFFCEALLSDSWSHVKFSFGSTSKQTPCWNETIVVHSKSPRASFALNPFIILSQCFIWWWIIPMGLYVDVHFA